MGHAKEQERALLMPRHEVACWYGMVPPGSRHASRPPIPTNPPPQRKDFCRRCIVTGDNTARSGRNPLAPCNKSLTSFRLKLLTRSSDPPGLQSARRSRQIIGGSRSNGREPACGSLGPGGCPDVCRIAQLGKESKEGKKRFKKEN